MNNFELKFTENVSLVTLNNISTNEDSLLKIFEIVSDEDICIDMISQTAPLNNTVNLSFTLDDADTAKIIAVLYKFKENFASLTTQILSKNTKILISSEKMKTQSGIATKVFRVLSENKIPISLITTSETEISLLINDEHSQMAKSVLQNKLHF